MKVVITIITLLAVIVGFGVWSYFSLSASAQELLAHIDELESGVERGEWPSATAEMEKINYIWQQKKDKWTMLINHEEIDNIDTSLSRAAKYVEKKETGLSLAEISVLRLLFEHIPDNQSLTLKNIL